MSINALLDEFKVKAATPKQQKNTAFGRRLERNSETAAC